jgi:hypothetical protein
MTDALVIPSLHSLLPDVQGTFHDRIMALEAEILKYPQVELPLRHWFCNGMYAREFTVPAGTLLTGAIHLHDSIAVMHKGRVRVLTEDGEHDIVAPQTFIQHAGTKRVGLVLEEMVWTTFHTCTATTVEEAERELVTNDRSVFLASATQEVIA